MDTGAVNKAVKSIKGHLQQQWPVQSALSSWDQFMCVYRGSLRCVSCGQTPKVPSQVVKGQNR